MTYKLFEGLTALDMTRGMAGGITTMVLADYGADVLKIEPPGGDTTRESPSFHLWNRGKKSLVLDLKSTEGSQQVQRLIQQTDILVESFRPGVTSRLGLGYEEVCQLSPGLVYCSITGFGRKGPYARLKGYEGVVAAKAGRMANLTGAVQREGPVYAAVHGLSYTASQIALQGIFAALHVREKTGRGQWVETNLLQGATVNGGGPGGGGDGGLKYFLQYLPARTKDGRWIQLANMAPHLFRAFMQCLGLEHLYHEPAFKNALAAVDGFGGRPLMTDAVVEETHALRGVLLMKMAEKTLAEWLEIFVRDGNVGGEPVLTAQEAMEHPQMLHNGHIVEMDDRRLGRVKQVGPLVGLANDSSFKAQPAPSLNQHRDEIVAWQQKGEVSAQAVSAKRNVGAQLPRYALEGVTVVDLADWLAGGLGPTLVADLGARVIKVERLGGDPLRGPAETGMLGVTVQGKESLAIDLKTPEGQAVIQKLVVKADLFVHNYRPGVPEKLGIGYETLSMINPNLVYLYAGAYGESGPYCMRPAFNPIPAAVCGANAVQAGAGMPPPSETPLSMEEIREVSRRLARADRGGGGDPNSGLAVATALLLGLYARERTGRGCRMLTTMLCSNAYANSDDFIRYEAKPPRPAPDANVFGLSALYRLYETASGWVFLACVNQREWEQLCQALGRRDWIHDQRFADPVARQHHDGEIVLLLERQFCTKTANEWERELSAADVACVRADVGDFSPPPTPRSAPQILVDNGIYIQTEHPDHGAYFRHGPKATFSLTPGRARPGSQVGEHTVAILEELGYSEQEIHELRMAEVVTWPGEP